VGALHRGVTLVQQRPAVTIPVHIISLASATHRRAYQAAQAKRLGFVPIWSDAVGTQDISDAIFHQYAFQWQRALKKTEVACFLSHLHLWQNIAKSDGPAVVLEDDVVLGGDWLADVQLLGTHQKADFICLETWGKKILGKSESLGHLELKPLILNSAGAAAYVLWPSGAQHLVARYERCGVALADAFINQTTGWRIWQLVPANAVQMSVAPDFGLPKMDHSESLIARELHAAAIANSLTVRCQMKTRRLFGELKKAWWQLTSLIIYTRSRVPFIDHHYR